MELKLEEKTIELAEKVDRLTRFSLESLVKDSKISELVKHREAQQNTSLRELSDEVEAVNRQLQEEKIFEELNKKSKKVDDLAAKLSNTQSHIEQLELKIRDIEESKGELSKEVEKKSKEVLIFQAKLQDQEKELKEMQTQKSNPLKRKSKEAGGGMRKSPKPSEKYPEAGPEVDAAVRSTKERISPALSPPSSHVPWSTPSPAPTSPSSIPLPTAPYIPPPPSFHPPIIPHNSQQPCSTHQLLAPPLPLTTSSLTPPSPPAQEKRFLSLRKLSNLVIQPQCQDISDEKRLLKTFGGGNSSSVAEEATKMEKEENAEKLLKHAVAYNVKKILQDYKQNLQVWEISSDQDFVDICRRLSYISREEIQEQWAETLSPPEALVVTEEDVARIKENVAFFFAIRKASSRST